LCGFSIYLLCPILELEMGKKNKKGKRKKVEITFDPDARKEWLKGFSKRKQERRKFGLAMQVLKDRKAKLEERKERKEALRESFQAAHEAVEEIEQHNTQTNNDKPENQSVDFEDEHTQAKFGDVVTVTTTLGIPGEESDEENSKAPKEYLKANASEVSRGKKGQGIDWEQRKANSLKSALKKVEEKLAKGKKKTRPNRGREQRKFCKATNAKHLQSKAIMLSRQKK